MDKSPIKISDIPGLADEVYFMFDTPALKFFAEKVAQNNGLDADKVADFAYEIALENFNFEDIDKRVAKEFSLDDDQAKKIAADIIGKIFLPVDGFVLDNPAMAELKKRKIDPVGYSAYLRRFELLAEAEVDKSLDKYMDNYEKALNSEDEVNTLLGLFKNDLLDILKSGTTDAVGMLNTNLLYLLTNKRGFSETLSKAMLSSEQLLSQQKIKIGEQEVDPTVGNWLRDFVSVHGSGMFELVTMSDFVTNSDNAKKLSDAEKSLLAHLLMTYRNVKFFPRTLVDIPAENWEIIPLEVPAKELKPAKPIAAAKDMSFLDDLDWDRLSAIEKRAVMEENGVTGKEIEEYRSK